MDSESCTRAFSQARVYLEQIRNRVTPGGPDVHGTGKRDYLVDAAKQIRLALERDVSEDYEEAFNHYKNGVDVLLNGVHVDPNKERREAVKRKITKYLKRAEEIFNCHLPRTLGNGSSTETGYSSLRFRPIRTLSTPLENLRRYKVVGIIDKVQIVQDPATGGTFILKSLPKSHVETRERQTIIPHGIPFMAKLLHYSVSEDSIFLHLEHVKGGTLWSHLRSQPHYQRIPSDSSTTLSPKLSLAVGHTKEAGLIGNRHDSSSKRCNLHPENSGNQISICVNHLLKSSDHSLSWKKSSDHIHARPVTDSRWHNGPAISPQGSVGGKHLTNVTHSGDAESSSKLMVKRHNHLAHHMTSFSCESFTTINGTGNLSHNGTPQQERKLQAGEKCSQSSAPVPKATRRCNMPKTESPGHQMPWVTHSPPVLPGQRQMYLGRCLQNNLRQENEWGISKMRDGRLVQEDVVLEHQQHQKQPSPGQYGSPEHWSSQRNDLQAWHVSEDQIQLWAAELLLALEGLHQQGVLCQDLNPRNLLLDSTGHISLTYFGQWTEVEPQYCNQALEDLYCAPEVGGISQLTAACDWWSFGALLYELLSGTSLSQHHPSGIHPHTQLYLPEQLSQSASSLLSELLAYDPKERLGCGKDGVDKIKSHSFFSTIQWNKLVSY